MKKQNITLKMSHDEFLHLLESMISIDTELYRVKDSRYDALKSKRAARRSMIKYMLDEIIHKNEVIRFEDQIRETSQ